MRVEVLSREEIEEKMLMTPGDIVMMLNEMGGMRVQATSPSLGAASVRVQGMRGRYTRFFSDGLPLFGEVGGLGLLQIPPMDLGQVEVIKGVASSLYGAGAMGGVVNLISRRPGDEAEREILVNRSTRGGDGRRGVVRHAGADRLGVDVARRRTLPGSTGRRRRRVGRPAGLLARRSCGRACSGTAATGARSSRRRGTPARIARAARAMARAAGAGVPYARRSTRVASTAARSGRRCSAAAVSCSARGPRSSSQQHDHQFGEIRERDRHETVFGEVTLRGAAGRHTLVGGVAFERDAYRPTDVPQFALHATTSPACSCRTTSTWRRGCR